MKLSAMFDRNAPNTFGKTDHNKKHSQRVTLSNCQGHSRNQNAKTWRTKNMPPPKKFEQGLP